MKFKSLEEFEKFSIENDISHMDIDLSNLNITKLNHPIKCHNLDLSYNKLSSIDVEIVCNKLNLNNNLIKYLNHINFDLIDTVFYSKLYSNTLTLNTVFLNNLCCSKLDLTENPIVTNSMYLFYIALKKKLIELIDFTFILKYSFYYNILTFPCVLITSLLLMLFDSFTIFIFVKYFLFLLFFCSMCYITSTYIGLVLLNIYIEKKLANNLFFKLKYNISIENLIEIKTSENIIEKYDYMIESESINNDIKYIYGFIQNFKEIDDTCIVCYDQIMKNKQYVCCNNKNKLHPVCNKCFVLSDIKVCMMCQEEVKKYYNGINEDDEDNENNSDIDNLDDIDSLDDILKMISKKNIDNSNNDTDSSNDDIDNNDISINNNDISINNNDSSQDNIIRELILQIN